jgi:hypothetical protein
MVQDRITESLTLPPLTMYLLKWNCIFLSTMVLMACHKGECSKKAIHVVGVYENGMRMK